MYFLLTVVHSSTPNPHPLPPNTLNVPMRVCLTCSGVCLTCRHKKRTVWACFSCLAPSPTSLAHKTHLYGCVSCTRVIFMPWHLPPSLTTRTMHCLGALFVFGTISHPP